MSEENPSDKPGSGETTPPSTSRRTFLMAAGITGAGLAVVGGGAGAYFATRGGAAATVSTLSAAGTGIPTNLANFGILFPSLRAKPFAEPGDAVKQALLEVGKIGGIMDARDSQTASPKALLLDPAYNGSPTALNSYGSNPFNPRMTQGSTFFGQFIDHDVTFDQSSLLGSPANPLLTRNQRTPRLDLDAIFGGGPTVSPSLYETLPSGAVGPKLKVGSGGVHEMLPNVANGDGTYTTLMADPRMNETLMLEGLTVSYVLVYNKLVDHLEDYDLSKFPSAKGADLSDNMVRFQVAREVLQWHYHWLVVNEHLPQVVGDKLTDDILHNGTKYYNPPSGKAFMPIEFGSAAYRFGHSIVAPSYRANFSSGTGASADPDKNPFFGLTFDVSIPGAQFDQNTSFDRPDMLGGFPAPRRYLGWQSFFDFGDGLVLNDKKIDTTISSTMFILPIPSIAPHTETSPTSLPQRNLLRQLTWAMSSGQDLAAHIRVDALAARDLEDIGTIYKDFATKTPLWYYFLAEAKTAAGGLTLGPAGGRVVGETLIGLIKADPKSYLNQHPGFVPFLGTDLKRGPNLNTAIGGRQDYTHAHLLYFAEVVTPGVYR